MFEIARTDPVDAETIYSGQASYPTTIEIPSELSEAEAKSKESIEAPFTRKDVATMNSAISTLKVLIAQRDALHEKNRGEYEKREFIKRLALLEEELKASKRENDTREAALKSSQPAAPTSAQVAQTSLTSTPRRLRSR